MNYRHIYHAGNFADVFKHVMLMLALEHLRSKEKPFFVLDTHGGIGLYDLQSTEAQKTGEAAEGIGRIWTADDPPPTVMRYRELVKNVNRRGGKGGALPRFYPGSPLVAQALLRAEDRLTVNELHPEDFKTLQKNLGGDHRVKIVHEDGYQLLKSQLPPPERRGLVLIDPPFEERDEFAQLEKGLRQAVKRWATGTYMIWYPVKDVAPVRTFHAALKESGISDILALEFMCRPPDNPDLFNGSGLIIVNPPWKLVEEAEEILPWLTQIMTDGKGSYRIERIAEEKG
jgi:23S rRNA (adenine2030-N6)-methyltransferase